MKFVFTLEASRVAKPRGHRCAQRVMRNRPEMTSIKIGTMRSEVGPLIPHVFASISTGNMCNGVVKTTGIWGKF